MEYIVERVTEAAVILEREDRTHLEVPRRDFLNPVREGDVVFSTPEGYRTDTDKTEKRRLELVRRTRRLFHKKD